MKVEGGKIMVDVSAGKMYSYPMAVSLGPTDPGTDLSIDIMGFDNSPSGAYTSLAPADDNRQYTARSFITVDNPVIHLNPGERKTFTATVQVPTNVGIGGRYATIYIHPKQIQGSSSGASIAIAVLLPVMLTVSGTTLTHTGSITNLDASEAVLGKPVTIQTTLKNTGNHHYYGAFVDVKITDSTGNVVATASTTPSIFALIPGNEMIIKTSIASLPAGTYTVKSDAKFGTTLLDTKTASFTLSEPSVAAPPTQAVSAPPTSRSPAKVTTQGGAAVVTSEGKPTTYTPLGIMTVMLALTAVFGILVMRRKG